MMRYSPMAMLGALLLVPLGLLCAAPSFGRTAPPAPTVAASVTYQGNPTHDGNLGGGTLTPPLRQAWAVNLGQLTSYPLVVGSRVFVTVRNASAYGTTLYALDGQSGATLWGPVDLGGVYYWSALAADGERIFAVNFSGTLRSYDAQTGTPGWSVQLPGQYAFSSAPTALNGTVYVGGAGSGGTIYAVDATNGALRWTAGVANGDESAPAVTSTGLYVAYPCQTYDLNPANGQVLWQRSTGCSGGGGRTVAVYNGRVYDRENGVVLDAASGALLGTIGGGPIPAFGGNQSFSLTSGTLRSNDLTSGATLWSFAGDGALSSAPLIVNGTVYIGSGGSRLYGLDPLSGSVVYSATLPAPVLGPDEHNVSQPLTGFGAGPDLLVVPASTWLVGFTSATSPSPTTTPATPIPTATATPTAGAQSVTYQIDAAHTGNLADPALNPPLRQRWARDLGRRVSYPLVVGSRAYVAVGDVGGTTLYAVDLQTGADVWGPLPLGSSWAALAYDTGQIFVIDTSGIERALDAQTGRQNWIIQLPNQYWFSSPPSARDGVVYTGGAGSGGTIYAVRETDGALLWMVPVINGDHSSPAVGSAGLYVGYPCQTYDLDPLTGQVLWHRNTGCSGGGGRTPALYNGRVYDRENGVVLDAATGALVGTIGASVAPAFAGNRGFYRTGGTLQAIDLATNAVLWSFAGDGALTSAPIVVNDTVYIGSGGSRLYGLDAATGAVRYTGTLPAPVEAPDENNQFELTGLSAGSGTLLVPAGTWLIAFTPDTSTPTSTATSTAAPASATTTPTATNTAPPTHTPRPSATATGTTSPPPVPTSTASPTPHPSTTPCAIAFSDVHPADYFYTPVRALACRGVISGYSDGTFRPTNNTSRAQMVKLVVLGLQVPRVTPPPGTATFADVPPGSPFYEVIETAATGQIVSGYACGGSGEPCDSAGRPYFRPYSNVTRGQLAKIVVIAASITRGWAVINPPRLAFADVPAGSVFYEFVETAYCHGILSGYTCGGPGEPCPGAYFRPGTQATRGQIAKIVYGAVTASGSCAP